MYYLDSEFNDSVWKTGKAYIGNKEIPVMLRLVSTVGDESLFRSFGYEEMKIPFGVLPQKFQKGLSPSTTAFDYGRRSLMTLGLEYSVAQHMRINVHSPTLLSLCYAGNGDNDITLSLNFSVPP